MNPPAAIRVAMLLKNWPAFFILSAGTILMLAGTAKVLGVFGTSQVLDLHDPIFGLPFRHLMLSMGIVELFVAFLCLFTNQRTLSLGLIAWLTANFLAYRIGLLTLDWHHSCGFLIDPLNLSLRTTDALMSAASVFLLIGSITTLWLGKETR